MSFGFEVRDGAGELTFTTDSVVARSTFAKTVQGNTSGSFSVPSFDDTKGIIGVDFVGFTDYNSFDGRSFSFSFDNSSKIFNYDLSNSESSVTASFYFISFA